MTRMHKKTRAALIPATLLVLSLMSCNRESATSPGTAKTGVDASQAGPLAARAMALAMAEPAIRAQVLADLRNSPYSEHKVVLQTYLQTAGGKKVLAAIERANIDAAQLSANLQALKPIQFYAPISEQRSAWRGTAGIVVIAELASARPEIAFTPTGTVAIPAQSLPSAEALFVLQWAEPMLRRWSGPTTATETIEIPGESQIGSGKMQRDASGQMQLIDDTPEGGRFTPALSPLGQSVPAGTYVDYVGNHGVCDHITCDRLELQFFVDGDGSSFIPAVLTGIGAPTGSFSGWWKIDDIRGNANLNMEIYLWEMDNTSKDDEFFCDAPDDPNCSAAHHPIFHGEFAIDYPLCSSCNEDPYLDVRVRDHADPVPTRVTLTPTALTIKKGSSYGQSLTATVRDQYDDLMGGQVSSWTSLNPTIASVAQTFDMAAFVWGVGGGQATIQATVGGASGTAPVTVLAPATITLSPLSSSICVGGQATYTATVKDQNGTVWTDGTVGWSSSSGSATVTSTGSRTATVRGVSSGTPTITATLDGANGTSTATVGPCLPTPTNCTITWIPQPRYMRVTWVNSDASASTEVDMNIGGTWVNKTTVAPGGALYFYTVGTQHGTFSGRVRHVKAGSLPSGYCTTGSATAP